MIILLVVIGAIMVHLMMVTSQFAQGRALIRNRKWVDLSGLVASGWLITQVGTNDMTVISAVSFALFSLWLWFKARRNRP